ncbi:MFS transporter [Salipiger abyssi]|uniref:MFS transporter n=1 Tax=Salipiger abyssi TaxID=1250539 RepID=UPI001A8FF615|nr:MFS transporter [Salipiger abyssi]MBN9888924.1 MFS transporter [Salipiger abyssi]
MHITDASGQSDANWPAVFSVSFAMFCLVTAELLPISLLSPMAADLAVSVGAAGQAVTLTAITAAVASPLFILGAGQVDRRPLVLGLVATLALSGVLSATASSLWMLLVARVLLGVALGGTWAMITALALRLVPQDKLARAMSIILTGVSAASVVAPPVGAYLGDIWSWRGTFIVAAILGVIAVAALIATLPKLPPAEAPGLSSFGITLTRGSVLAGLVAIFLVLSGHYAGFTYIRPFFEQVVGLQIHTISLALFLFGAGGVAGSMIGGIWASRSASLAAGGSAIVVMLAAGALMLAATTLAFAATAIWGFAFGAFSVAIATWNAEAAPDHAESVGALQASSFQIAIAIGAGMGGIAVAAYGPAGVLIYTCAAALGGAALILTAGFRARGR